MRVNFETDGHKVPVFVKRPETLFGVTYIVLPRSVSSKFAINPINGEKIPTYVGDVSEPTAAVPGHDQHDYDVAQKHNLPIRIVLEPLTGQHQENPELRKSIVALVRNPRTNEILSINWGPEMGGNLFIGGGRNENEDPVECAKREIAEETGYNDVTFVAQSERIHHRYFAHSKNKARQIEAIGLLFELKSDARNQQKLEADEVGKFKVEWLTEAQAAERVKD